MQTTCNPFVMAGFLQAKVSRYLRRTKKHKRAAKLPSLLWAVPFCSALFRFFASLQNDVRCTHTD